MSNTKILNRKQAGKNSKPLKQVPVKKADTPSSTNNESKQVPLSELDTSPFNYRMFFPKAGLEELAADIALHGIISNLLVRPIHSGRFEIVAGERRYRAASMIGLKELPVKIVYLNDQEVIEYQLSENFHREGTHPMQEALAIGELQKIHNSIDEIAARIAKSKTLIYSRLKLLSLNQPLREVFLANKCTAAQAFEIASLSSESQSEFFSEYCEGWKRNEHFKMPNLNHVFDQYRYDLTEAPFNIKDKKLVPEAGACTTCPFNSATLKTLFPDLAKEAICTKKECYRSKCQAQTSVKVKEIFREHEPQALIYYGSPDHLETVIQLIPEAASLPRYNYHHVKTIEEPELPKREDYINEQEEDEEDGEKTQTDEEAFSEALQEYRDDLEEYKGLVAGGRLITGLLVSESRMSVVVFNLEERRNNQPQPELPKAAEVQAAIKTGTASVELLQGEINRINIREARSQELDREKIQLMVHEKFEANLNTLNPEPTTADQVTVRLILFQSLNYSAKTQVLQMLGMKNEKFDYSNNEELYRQLENLTAIQFAYLIRMAVSSNSDSKNPRTESGYFLYKMAEQAGLDIAIIEKEQKAKADERQVKQEERIAGLQKQIEKIQSKE